MRRVIALIIMLLVPLQFAWSAAAGLYGHMGEDVALQGVHAHVHDHHDNGHTGHDASGEPDEDHNQDGHHDHYHPVFSSILVEFGLTLDSTLPSGPILHPSVAYLSQSPPLLDRPPLARA